ncbi:MAG: sigma-70 family RNA polymerase sigma factor [Anaerolineae bacterium]
MTTDALLGRVALESPDEAEFEALFLAHYDEVYRLLFRIVGSRQEAEDLAQETFLRLYRQRFPVDRERNMRAWLYRVATNLGLNALRGRRRREQRIAAAAHQATAISDSPLDPAEAALRRDEREAVRRVLAGLPPRQAKLLLLRHAGLTYRELADAIGVAPGSVGTLLARAMAAFEQAYRAEVVGLEQGMGDS